MFANVRLRVSRSVILIIMSCLFLGMTASTAASIGAGAAKSPSASYTEAFCGTVPPTFRLEPVVLPPHSSPMDVQVSIMDFAFSPSDLTINVGDTVTWTNNDGAFHTTASDTGVWSSGDLLMGQTFSFTFMSAGQFPYHCGRHSFMTANITVMDAASPTPTPAISGTIAYGNAIGNPNPRFVSNVLLTAAGSPNIFTTTGFPNGTYTLAGFGAGSYTVTPTKTGGVNAITSFDAGKVAQHAAGIVLLTGNQLLVADTSGNGQVTSFDAAQVARYASGLSNAGSTGTWKFIPVNRSYASVSTNVAGEDFVALLMGEVSGNWANTAPPSPTPTP